MDPAALRRLCPSELSEQVPAAHFPLEIVSLVIGAHDAFLDYQLTTGDLLVVTASIDPAAPVFDLPTGE